MSINPITRAELLDATFEVRRRLGAVVRAFDDGDWVKAEAISEEIYSAAFDLKDLLGRPLRDALALARATEGSNSQ